MITGNRRLWLLCILLGVAGAATARRARAQRVAAPAEATVLIRVIGDVRTEFFGAGARRIEEQTAVEVSSGTGFVISPFGYVVTANHVIADREVVERRLGGQVRASVTVSRIEVVFREVPAGSVTAVFVASLVGTDSSLDLAMLSIPANEPGSTLHRPATLLCRWGWPGGGMFGSTS